MKTSIGVMGSSAVEHPGQPIEPRIVSIATSLGEAIATRQCALVTGATSGLPHIVTVAAKAAGGLTIGISPAVSEKEHRERYGLPIDGLDVVVYTGFGLKGRNVINIRSSDIVIIIGGSTGTLNEFTIALDEGRIIGVLEGTGGISDHIRDIVRFCNKEGGSRILFNENPDTLVDSCLAEFKQDYQVL
jgi:uncharacterized protein (TIGR00725 family)